MQKAEIPKIFHRIWLGSPMPEEFVEYGRRWRELHPGWSLVEWDEQMLLRLPMRNSELFRHANAMCPRSPLQFASDVARLEILWAFGGVYVDTDMDPRKNIEELLREQDHVYVAWEDHQWMNNAFIAAPPHHPLLGELIRQLPDSVRANPNGLPNKMSGPQFLTNAIGSAEWVGAGGPCDEWARLLRVEPSAYFYPYRWDELRRAGEDFPDAYAIHRWANKRDRRKRARA